ncbi:glycosyltransferase family 9 protein [Candidatus Poribacteria bacterium]
MRRKVQQLSRSLEEYTTLIFSSLVNLAFYRRKDLASAEIRRIAVIKLDHIGDVILSIPAVANLRAHFPQAYIAMVVKSSSESVARYIPYVDKILCYDARYFDRSRGGKMLDLSRGMRFARDMRNREFDLIVDLRGSFASLLFAMIAKSEHRVDRGTYLIQRKSGKISPSSEHEAEVNLDILARAGVPIRLREMFLELEKADLDSVESLLRGDGELGLRSPVVVIHPGGPASLKRWSAERYAQLACELMREYSVRIVLVGGKGEKQIARSIVSQMNKQAIDLSGRTTLGQLAAVFRKANLFIGNDSGPMHLAAACGTKVIGLFGPTSPQRFRPYGDNCIALRMETDCPPCMREECKISEYRCIDTISVDDVMDTVRQMFPHSNSMEH